MMRKTTWIECWLAAALIAVAILVAVSVIGVLSRSPICPVGSGYVRELGVCLPGATDPKFR
jgi:hypothetical protein